MVIDHSNDHQYPERFPKYEFALPNALLEVQFLQEAMTHAARLERWPGLTSKNLLKLNYDINKQIKMKI